MKVSVIGATGWVGKAMLQLFPSAYAYSRHVGTKEEANKADVAFICVPSPLKDGKLDTSIVEECIAWITCPLIVVRSTVNPGDCDRWAEKYNKRIMHQPEFLGETPNHPLLDQKQNQFIIIGGKDRDCLQLINLYSTTYNASIKIRQVSRLESEVIKLTENRAIAFKVMQCQELYDACQAMGINYYKIRDAVYGDDPRFNLWFTFIYPNKRGFNSSKCLVKDVPAWASWARSVGIDPVLTEALVKRSNEYEATGEVKIRRLSGKRIFELFQRTGLPAEDIIMISLERANKDGVKLVVSMAGYDEAKKAHADLSRAKNTKLGIHNLKRDQSLIDSTYNR